MGKVLVTGAAGFIGRRVCEVLHAQKISVQPIIRTQSAVNFPQAPILIGNITAATDWHAALVGVDTIIHLAARVHVMQDTAIDPLAEFRTTNVDATLNLAKQAIQAGVRRFIFVSTVKVNGEETPQRPYTVFDQPAPLDPYGKSKLEAELALQALANESGLELVIIRSPLVYGPHVRANFFKLMQITQMGLPLPFGGVNNRRSLVALDNLVDLLITCIYHPQAVNQIFLISDDDDVSLSKLLQLIAQAMNKKIWLLPAPIKLLQLIGILTGKSAVINRLFGSLQVDINHTKQTLNWQPLISVDQGIQQTVQHFLTDKSSST